MEKFKVNLRYDYYIGLPDEARKKGQQGRVKQSKARNLLERLMNFEEDE